MTTMNRTHLADAYIKVATADHYLVGVLPTYTWEDLNEAEQILIEMDNEAGNNDPVLNYALDILDHDRKHLLLTQPSGWRTTP